MNAVATIDVPGFPQDILDAATVVEDEIMAADLVEMDTQYIIAKALMAEREKAAAIAEQTEIGISVNTMARLALKVAARAIRRGRHLTAAEKLQNVQNWLAEEGVE